MRNLGFRADDRARFVVLEPERLRTIAELEIAERCMARFSSDRAVDQDHLYFTTPTDVRRLIYHVQRLELDENWAGSYGLSVEQSDAWDTTLGGDSVWLMDMGRSPAWLGRAMGPQRALRFSIEDPADRDVIDAIGQPGAWNPPPPLYDPTRQILVHFDSVNRRVVAHRYEPGAPLRLLWEQPFRNFTQMIVWLDTGELVVEDSSSPHPLAREPSADAVLVEIEIGSEIGRAPIGAAATTGMFCSPRVSPGLLHLQHRRHRGPHLRQITVRHPLAARGRDQLEPGGGSPAGAMRDGRFATGALTRLSEPGEAHRLRSGTPLSRAIRPDTARAPGPALTPT